MNDMVPSLPHWPSEAIAGEWHLIGREADVVRVPWHRVGLVLESEGSQLRGDLRQIPHIDPPLSASVYLSRLEIP